MKNWCYTIKDGEHASTTLWSGRYVAVCGIVTYLNDNGELMFLVNKRGEGTPDFQGCWNLTCGFLEADESGEQGCAREIFEECGIRIKNISRFKLCSVETDPEKCNNGNVTIRYMLHITDKNDYDNIIDDSKFHTLNTLGGEENEVADVMWVNEKDIDKYDWAFNHYEIIQEHIKQFHIKFE